MTTSSQPKLTSIRDDDLRVLIKGLKDVNVKLAETQLSSYEPYAKQKKFHLMSSTCRERLLMAGNQQGKTFCGANEMAMHLTGLYPRWWKGRRFERPIVAWVSGETSDSVRKTVQKLLLGHPFPHGVGTGTIPKDTIVRYTMQRGISDAVDTILVRHKTGGLSELSFTSYEKGREKWQGATLDLIWFDEEPPPDIYSEGMARITATKGMVYVTFTPLKGKSEVVTKFLDEDNPNRGVVTMTIEDAEHISPERYEEIIAGYRPHEREARIQGIPMFGAGRVFTVSESVLACDPFDIPDHWAVIAGLDLGTGGMAHPTAAAWLAWDRDADVVYVFHTYKQEEPGITVNAAALKTRGQVPVAWPHDAHQQSRESAKPYHLLYKRAGVNMLPTHAQFPNKSMSVEAGIDGLRERMEKATFRVFRTESQWFEEYREYHRDEDAKIVKKKDDLMDATRYGYIMLRFAKTMREVRDLSSIKRRLRSPVADGVDYDLFKV